MYLNRHYIFDLFLLEVYVQKLELNIYKEETWHIYQHRGTFSYEKKTFREATNMRHATALKTGNPNL